MDISTSEDFAALEAVSSASGNGDWADVMPALRSAVAPERIGLWRQSAASRGLIERHPDMMNIARITVAGQHALRALHAAG